jgi:hypothetical protein
MKSLLPSLKRLETTVNICKLLGPNASAMKIFWIHLKENTMTPMIMVLLLVVTAAVAVSV